MYGIVKQAGGTIDLLSEVGVGTTFRTCLPRTEGEPVPVIEPVPQVASAGGETVLLAEDDEIVRELARTVLERRGYTVLEARDVDDALRLGREHAGEIGLLLTDVVMPKLNGRELLTRLRESRPGLRALFMSGYAEDILSHRGILAEGT